MSHTSSTAAGKRGKDVSFSRTGRRYCTRCGFTLARIVAHKVWYSSLHLDVKKQISEMLLMMHDATTVGVDLITISIGHAHALNFSDESISIGSFHAMKNGILTSNSAGNRGPRTDQLLVCLHGWSMLKPTPHIVTFKSLRYKVVREWKDNSGRYRGLFYKHLYTMKLQCSLIIGSVSHFSS